MIYIHNKLILMTYKLQDFIAYKNNVDSYYLTRTKLT